MRPRIVLSMPFIAAAVVLLSSAASAAPLSCPAGTTDLESQVWWDPIPGGKAGFPGGHVHTEVCFPVLRTVPNGPATYQVRQQLHNNPNTLSALRWGAVGGTGALPVGGEKSQAIAGPDADVNTTLTYNHQNMNVSGWEEHRITSDVRKLSNGNRMYTTSRYPALYNNGKPLSNYAWNGSVTSPGRCGGGGWYTGVEYITVGVYCGDLQRMLAGSVPRGFCMRVNFDRRTGAGGLASLDPSFHASPPNPGQVMYSGAGGTGRSVCIPSTATSGAHKVFLRTDVKGTAPAGTASGAFVFPITVS